MWKVLTRSERHMMFFGGYLGMGLVIVADSVVGRVSGRDIVPPASLLSVPLLIAFFVITGLRFVFDMPASVESNWVFRSAALHPLPRPSDVVRRFMLIAVIPPLVTVCLLSVAPRYGLLPALLHATAVAVMTELGIGIVLLHFQKIPFTCIREPETRRLMLRFLFCLLSVLAIVPILANIEHWAIERATHFLVLSGVLLIGWFLLERHRNAPAELPTLAFEERSPAAFEILKLA
jgi:hypothetical protein